MKTPPFLMPGDKIRIVSPASKCTEEQIFPAVNWLREKGFQVETGRNIFKQFFQYAGKDEDRLSDLQEALDDREAKAIICSRGGYGAIRLIDQLNFSRFRRHPKWLVGFSDITVLHNRLHLSGFPSIHGTMCRNFFSENPILSDTLLSLTDLLRGEKPEYRFVPSPMDHPGTETARLVGGNLSLLCSLFGTPYDLDTAGKILFIEDIGEYLYHIDRMMVSLRLTGKLKYLAGLVVGQFTDVKDNEEPFGKSVEEIILDAVRNYNFPVCFNFPAGHGQPNLALRLGSVWKLKVTENICSLKLLK
jgi:muramoyltetrapeptide carboxypeptidase